MVLEHQLGVAREIRDGKRSLAKRPAFTAVAIVSLTLGIGANTAIFSLVNAVILRDSPIERPEEVVNLYLHQASFGFGALSYPDFEDVRDGAAEVFSDIAASHFVPLTIDREEGGGVGLAPAEAVTGSYFPMLGIEAAVGRTLLPSDDVARGGHPVVMLDYSYWQSAFAGDPDVVGQPMRVRGRAVAVEGPVGRAGGGHRGAAAEGGAGSSSAGPAASARGARDRDRAPGGGRPGRAEPLEEQVDAALTAAESDAGQLARAGAVHGARWSRLYYVAAAGAFGERFTLEQVDAVLADAESFAERTRGLSHAGRAVLGTAVEECGEHPAVAELVAALERAQEAEREDEERRREEARRRGRVAGRERDIRATKHGPVWLGEATERVLQGADRPPTSTSGNGSSRPSEGGSATTSITAGRNSAPPSRAPRSWRTRGAALAPSRRRRPRSRS
ncbi:MAG: hypothetical protein F4X11_15595 [Acidobacteria bacterium]|nr:hypothetical protein [Acidobacteriota bacterium]